MSTVAFLAATAAAALSAQAPISTGPALVPAPRPPQDSVNQSSDGEYETSSAAGGAPVTSRPTPTEGMGEIVVTATKQSQTLQKTAAAITAIDGRALVQAGITDIRGVQAFVPSVRFQQEGANTEIYIRGIGNTVDYPQVDPPTSFNFNGIYMPREATAVGLFDIDQIEVLPGPQGTLYGRSTIGGTVNINFRRPTQYLETRGLLEAGNYSLLHGSVAQNVPLGDKLAIRLAADYLYHSGYMTSGADAADNYGVRLSILYTPTDRLTAYIWGMTSDLNGSPPNLVPKGVTATGELSPNSYVTDDPWNDQFPAALVPALPAGQPQAEDWGYHNHLVGAQIDYDLTDTITLTYIPSYLDNYSSPNYWLGAFPGNLTANYEQTTHELRLAQDSDRLDWLLGLYGYRMVSSGVFAFGGFSLATGFPVSIVDRNRIKGAAVFGQATYSITDAFRITLGGRYSLDDRVGAGRFLTASGLAPVTFSKNYHRFDYKAAVEYDVAPRVMLYAATQTGYQPGTFNQFFGNDAAGSNEVRQAKMTAYTAGIKSRFLDGRLQINNEVFYYDYRDLFVASYDTVLNANRIFNADKVVIYGDQLDIIFAPTDSDQLSLTVGYLHGRNKDFVLPDGSANYNGLQLQYAPDWTVNAGYYHDFRMSGGGYIRAQANTRYESSFFGDFAHTPGTRQKSYTKTDASLTYYSPGERWSVGAWIKNIENEAVIAATAAGSNIPFNPLGATSFLEAPRTYGLRATFNF